MAETSRECHVGRLDVALWTRDQVLPLRAGGATSLALAPEGNVLYALGGGRLCTIDAATWKPGPSLRVGPAVFSLCAGNRGRLYLLERRMGAVVHVVDLPNRKLLTRWGSGLMGRVSGRSSPDGCRLYLATSAVLSGSIQEVDLSATELSQPVFLRQANSNRDRLIRGDLLLSPDGQFLVTGNGFVFRAAS
jgi:hypothetical protein